MNLLEKLKEKLTPLPTMSNDEIITIEQTLKSIIDGHKDNTHVSKFWIRKYFTTNGSRVNHNLAVYLHDATYVCILDESKTGKNSISFLVLRNNTKGVDIVDALAQETDGYAEELNNKLGDRYACIAENGYIRVVKVK